MFTILWRENSIDRWDRYETKEELDIQLNALKNNQNVSFGDIWIFAPAADNYVKTADEYNRMAARTNK